MGEKLWKDLLMFGRDLPKDDVIFMEIASPKIQRKKCFINENGINVFCFRADDTSLLDKLYQLTVTTFPHMNKGFN